MSEITPISVISWNCLADSYAQGTTVGKRKNCAHLISWPQRWRRISHILHRFDADLISLQEVDHFESHFKPFFLKSDYNVRYVQRPGREDGVLIAFKKDKFDLLCEDSVHFDELADVKTLQLPLSTRNKLKRKNVALILALRKKTFIMGGEAICGLSFSIASTHLYWNPLAPHIKLSQATYLIKRIALVHEKFSKPLVASILAGDFNSLPQSQTYRRIMRGTAFPLDSEAVHDACKHLVLSYKPGEPVKFLCDSTLTRMMRWLRLLGIDVTLEDNYSEQRRSEYNDFSILFEQAREQRRVIVTTSTSMLRRSTCPEVFVVRPSSESLESQISKLLNFYNVELNESSFLSICGKCGGAIESCEADDCRLEGKAIPRDRPMYVCIKCFQAYWNGDSDSAVSARALQRARTLFAYVQAERMQNQQSRETSRQHTTRSRNSQCSKLADNLPEMKQDRRIVLRSSGTPRSNRELSRKEWLRYTSALMESNEQEPEYTNVNGTFRGTLDYIFVAGSCVVSSSMVVSGTSGCKQRKSFPNIDWPSDHMMLHAEVILQPVRSGRLPLARSSTFTL